MERKKGLVPKEYEEQGFRRFVKIKKQKNERFDFYLWETFEVVYNTLIPFVAGYMFSVEINLVRLLAIAFLVMPIVLRFYYNKSEKTSRFYFRL